MQDPKTRMERAQHSDVFTGIFFQDPGGSWGRVVNRIVPFKAPKILKP